MSIEVRELTKKYGEIIGVEQLSLNVGIGQFQGFIGPNGAGKSTTIRCLMGLLTPDSGTFSILGFDDKKAMASIKASVGYLPSEIRLYRKLSTQVHIALAIAIRRDAIASVQGKAAAAAFEKHAEQTAKTLSKRLSLDVQRPFGALSFGNQKKAGIVLSMLHEPPVLILDEPTGGLDPLVQETFFELLKERHTAGTTILYSSHILSEVERLCDKVAIVKSGNVIANEAIEHFRQKRLKRVMLKCHEDRVAACAAMVEQSGEASRVQIDRNVIQMDWHGLPSKLTALMTSINPKDFTVTEPSLESIFMHYYHDSADDAEIGGRK
ncbi:MAG: beta-exotoxin transport system ATP-binding protein [Clostridiales bacterium]|jgi:ABC-2 type transport system ATP-binding protein|nr:beta-exotoxin transport system ATP-binding protein [Clostridiales bacterium]MDN5299174.1 beta-exotoxin transport system ATP-binding protein [Clostridiales bacterium]